MVANSIYIYIYLIEKLYIFILLIYQSRGGIVETLKELHELRKKIAFPFMVNTFSKPRYREPLDKEHQETLNMYVKQIYNPRFRKLKEAEYFREEFIEPETGQVKTQA